MLCDNRRISHELSSICNISDVIVIIMDIRNPLGTWSNVFGKIRKKMKKKIVIILNKIDLVPPFVVSQWLKIFSRHYPTIAFHASLKKFHGKKNFLNILKQLKKKIFLKKNILTIGIIGFTNVGKSSVINTLRGEKSSCVSPNAGETKRRKFIKISKSIFLIDSPGIMFNENTHSFVFSTCKKKELNLFPENLELYDKIIDSMVGKAVNNNFNNYSKIKNSIAKEYILDFSSLKKGGNINGSKKVEEKIENFNRGTLPWFSPIPNYKNIKKKLSFHFKFDKEISFYFK